MSKFTAKFSGAKRKDLYLYDQELLGLALSMRFPSDRGSGMIGYLVSDKQYANEPWQYHGPAITAEAEVHQLRTRRISLLYLVALRDSEFFLLIT